MSKPAIAVVKAVLGGLLCLAFGYALVLGAHVLEQLYPCRAVDPDTGVPRAVSCFHTSSPETP